MCDKQVCNELTAHSYARSAMLTRIQRKIYILFIFIFKSRVSALTIDVKSFQKSNISQGVARSFIVRVVYASVIDFNLQKYISCWNWFSDTETLAHDRGVDRDCIWPSSINTVLFQCPFQIVEIGSCEKIRTVRSWIMSFWMCTGFYVWMVQENPWMPFRCEYECANISIQYMQANRNAWMCSSFDTMTSLTMIM